MARSYLRAVSSLSTQDLRRLYRFLVLTRALEEQLDRLFEQGRIVGTLYRSLGQEATPVGSAYALRPGDWLAPSRRDLGALLVRGLEPGEIFLQYAARAGALCAGKDRADRVTVPGLGLLGSIGPLGTQLCVLNGVGLAFRMRGEERVCMAYQGDGETRTGASHEGLAFAAAQRLPMVVVIEHNHWAFATRSEREAAVARWTDVAKAYGVPSLGVDGNDPLAVYDAARTLVDRARAGHGLGILVAETYSMVGHAPNDPRQYVPAEELESWRSRDPLARYERYLLDQEFTTEAGLEEIRAGVDRELTRAVEETLAASMLDPEDARSRVYDSPEPAPAPWTRRSPVGYADLPVSPLEAAPVPHAGE